jgi:hypothetical protein
MFQALLASVDGHLLARHRHCQANPPAQSAQTLASGLLAPSSTKIIRIGKSLTVLARADSPAAVNTRAMESHGFETDSFAAPATYQANS